MVYKESDFLKISGIQHFSFCRRQWALIHIEGQWQENVYTADGQIFHDRAHNTGLIEKRKNLLIVRGLKIFSSTLGVSGDCDVVEFQRDDENGVRLQNYSGNWLPVPIEYKSGSSKANDADRLQLCLQAMCLEEMLCCNINKGYLYYGETNRREEVSLDNDLRESVTNMLIEMHKYMNQGYTPKVKTGKYCNACSLRELCLPKLCKGQNVSDYIFKTIHCGEECEE